MGLGLVSSSRDLVSFRVRERRERAVIVVFITEDVWGGTLEGGGFVVPKTERWGERKKVKRGVKQQAI